MKNSLFLLKWRQLVEGTRSPRTIEILVNLQVLCWETASWHWLKRKTFLDIVKICRGKKQCRNIFVWCHFIDWKKFVKFPLIEIGSFTLYRSELLSAFPKKILWWTKVKTFQHFFFLNTLQKQWMKFSKVFLLNEIFSAVNYVLWICLKLNVFGFSIPQQEQIKYLYTIMKQLKLRTYNKRVTSSFFVVNWANCKRKTGLITIMF